jgi:hypothetical protein
MLGAIPPLPQYVFMAWCLVKHRDNFTFYLYNFTPKIFVEEDRPCQNWKQVKPVTNQKESKKEK